MNKNLIAAGLVTGITAATVVGTAAAQTSARQAGLVDKIATTFGLTTEEVQASFDEYKAEFKAERQAERAEQLQALVDDGTLTQEQLDQINDYRDQMQALKESLQSSGEEPSDEDRQQVRDLKDEFKTWLEEQGLDELDIFQRDGRKHSRSAR